MKCKYCPYELKLEKVYGDLYIAKCTNPNHAYAVYMRYKWVKRWEYANI